MESRIAVPYVFLKRTTHATFLKSNQVATTVRMRGLGALPLKLSKLNPARVFALKRRNLSTET
jgi:hypothetical protein